MVETVFTIDPTNDDSGIYFKAAEGTNFSESLKKAWDMSQKPFLSMTRYEQIQIELMLFQKLGKF